MNTSIAKAISVILIATTLVVATSNAQGAPPERKASLHSSVTVKFADLNTATPEGARILYRRIQSAARKVCGSSSPWDPGSYWASKICYDATVNDAVLQVNRPTLTALHRSLTKGATG